MSLAIVLESIFDTKLKVEALWHNAEKYKKSDLETPQKENCICHTYYMYVLGFHNSALE